MDVAKLIDPDVAEALRAFPLDLGTLTNERLPALRAGMVAASVPLSDRVARTRVVVPAAGGEPEVALHVHRPVSQSGPLPCVYWIHGGGYVLGSPTQEAPRFDRWCQELGIVGVCVQYRLAPETPYPGPLEDCYRGLRYVAQHAQELGIRTDRLGIGGPSAGGGLAAGLGLLARDRGEVPLAFQLLVYPMIDDRRVTPSSQWEVPVWPPRANAFGWASYLGKHAGGEVPIYAAAARAKDLRGLPPSLIAVGTLDGFVDEDLDYAQRLNQAGVPVELHLYPGGPHGFDGLAPATALARRARRDMEEWLARMVRS